MTIRRSRGSWSICLAVLGMLGVVLNTASQTPNWRASFSYATFLGCGDLYFHAVNTDGTEVLQIEVDFSRLGDDRGRRIFDLSKSTEGVIVAVLTYSRPQRNAPNCSDVILHEVGRPLETPARWRAIRGQLIVERGPSGINPDEPWLFEATIALRGVAFRLPSGQTVDMRAPLCWKGRVGWQAGT